VENVHRMIRDRRRMAGKMEEINSFDTLQAPHDNAHDVELSILIIQLLEKKFTN
jgi:hypothetical protein